MKGARRKGTGTGVGSFTDVGADDLASVTWEYDVGGDTYAGAFSLAEGIGVSSRILDMDLSETLEPNVFLPLLGDALQSDPRDESASDAGDAKLFIWQMLAEGGFVPLAFDEGDEGGEAEGSL